MAKIRNIMDVPAWRLCMGCGTCYAACTKGGVELVNVESEGIRPRFDAEKCSGCTDCLNTCPGWRLNADFVMEECLKTTEADHEFGQTLEIWEGHAVDPEIRHEASSGGLLSALSLYCLEQEGMEFALHTASDPERPWLNRTVQSHTRTDLLSRTGSRYAPASPCDGLEKIAEAKGPCVFIGKPCDAAGASMLREQRSDIDRNLGAILTFCCAGTPSTKGTLDLLQSLGASAEEIENLNYRGEGWPGGFNIRQRKTGKKLFIPYIEAWGRLTKYVCFRCRMCPDGLGRLADIACGDAWESYDQERQSDAGPGLSLCLVRTERGREIVRGAIQSGFVKLRPISKNEVLKAQRSLLGRRQRLFGRLLAIRLLNAAVPCYTGFSLRSSWRNLPFSEKAIAVLGTIRRGVKRRWYRTERLF